MSEQAAGDGRNHDYVNFSYRGPIVVMDPAEQIRQGIEYIRARYGRPKADKPDEPDAP